MTGGIPTEAAALAEAKQAVMGYNAQLWKVVAIAAIVLLLAVGAVLGYVVNLNADTNTKVSEIQQVQRDNTARTNCVEGNILGLFADIPLLLGNDKDPSHYSKIDKSCPAK